MPTIADGAGEMIGGDQLFQVRLLKDDLVPVDGDVLRFQVQRRLRRRLRLRALTLATCRGLWSAFERFQRTQVRKDWFDWRALRQFPHFCVAHPRRDVERPSQRAAVS